MTERTPMNRLMQGVIPYLALQKADDAIAFYEKAFGAVVRGDISRDPQGLIMNASLEVNGGCLMVMDYAEHIGSPPLDGSNSMTMQIVSPTGRAMWDQAIAAGCTVAMPFEKQFWGDEYGRLADPFGVKWAILQPSPENLARGAENPMA